MLLNFKAETCEFSHSVLGLKLILKFFFFFSGNHADFPRVLLVKICEFSLLFWHLRGDFWGKFFRPKPIIFSNFSALQAADQLCGVQDHLPGLLHPKPFPGKSEAEVAEIYKKKISKFFFQVSNALPSHHLHQGRG